MTKQQQTKKITGYAAHFCIFVVYSTLRASPCMLCCNKHLFIRIATYSPHFNFYFLLLNPTSSLETHSRLHPLSHFFPVSLWIFSSSTVSWSLLLFSLGQNTVYLCFITHCHFLFAGAARSLLCTSISLFIYFLSFTHFILPHTLSHTYSHPCILKIDCSGKLLYLPTPSNLMLIHHLTLLPSSLSVAHPFLANSSSWIIAVRKKFSMHTWWALWSISLSPPLKVYPFFLILPCLTEEPGFRHTRTLAQTPYNSDIISCLQEETHGRRNLSLSGTMLLDTHSNANRFAAPTRLYTHTSAYTQMHTCCIQAHT